MNNLRFRLYLLWSRGRLILLVQTVLMVVLLRLGTVSTGVPTADERLPFTKITQALPNSRMDDLLSLLKTVDELTSKAFSDFRGQEFQAEAAFLERPTDQYLTLDQSLQLIKGLNPAELDILTNLINDYVLDNLVRYKFVGARYSAGKRYFIRWDSTGKGMMSSAVGMLYVVPEGVSWDDIEQRDKLRDFASYLVMYYGATQDDIQQPADLLKSIVDLAQSAQQAKAAGDQLKASSLYEQAMSLLKERGVSGRWLELLRDRWPVSTTPG